MRDEIVFLPNRRRVSAKQVALIFSGFLIFVQLFVLESEPPGIRIGFTAAFVVFLLLGFWLSATSSRSWPQKIVINRLGICCGKMKSHYGVDFIPWNDVAGMDLFYTDHMLPPHLRITLRQGAFRERSSNDLLHRLSMGRDVSIPVSVNVSPEVVLQTAQQYWMAADAKR
ncbi:MAG: hypothetical protein R3F27_06080 [Gammaproteobacteria bacterium]